MPELGEILRAETADLHERLGTLPYFSALRAGTLRRGAIVSFLRSLAIIHGVLERSLYLVSSPPIADLSRHAARKVPLLLADLAALGAQSSSSVTAAIRCALDYAAEILTSGDNPLTLVGVLYVLEGSQNGGVALKHDYARCLNVPEDRLAYIGCYGIATAAHWKGFIECLNGLTLDDDQVKEVAQAATRCFEELENICAELYPYDDRDLEHHVTAVNHEAGDHAMPQNPLHIALALRVGRASWRRYPYLEYRFGERGKRFSRSDSCWLVALTQMSVESATKSLDWLRTILASRGIATVILEDHLAALSRELALGSPGQPQPCAHYARFLSSRAAERGALLDTESATQLIDQFDRRFRSCTGLTVKSAAKLIASAWVDERSGMDGALAAVRDWFVDVERFSRDWIANVDEFLVKLDQAAKTSC
jgi:heme oxygenase